jgi:UDP-3-O-[3-hydroxymyristoyl] glucosamine N-acyltransferase
VDVVVGVTVAVAVEVAVGVTVAVEVEVAVAVEVAVGVTVAVAVAVAVGGRVSVGVGVSVFKATALINTAEPFPSKFAACAIKVADNAKAIKNRPSAMRCSQRS